MKESVSQPNRVEALAEEFLERRRTGERPTIAEYTAKYPELAEEIRACFPALLLVEDFKPDMADITGPATAAAGLGPGIPGGRLGDYRLLREVGRGGMGVVYEAEQESLGRHVALKVLPAQALLDPKHVQRFQREAKAAARLHHTNIVPVFGVGECAGLHYYVMQFIHGLGLDQVLDELKRLRQGRTGMTEADHLAATERAPAGRVAEALLTGRFSVSPDKGPAEQAADVPPPAPLAVAPSAADSTTPIHLPGQAEHSTLSGSGRSYCQSVARVGVQVAEALAHAHGQGILHRDIKPANLLLDMHGTVWVTDFGLAKADDGDGLTQTGDIVGTLRYMAPERFGGKSDPRSDLYGLGVTLYELLTLRPAFAEADHNKLLQRVLHDEPPRPRRLNAEVPRDLETIVLKAIAKEPKQRYASAAELAEDLRRFLADRPVKARRASALERLWRWVRRNPALAAALAAAAALLLAVAAVASWDTWRLQGEQQATRHQLYGALVAQARASRRSRGAGQHFDSLATLEQATELARQLHLPEQDFLELRNEVIACLALPDMRVAREWNGCPEGNSHVHFDEKLERYARMDRQGSITVRRVADDEEICHLPPGTEAGLDLSPDGRFLWVSRDTRGKLWDVTGPKPRVIVDPDPIIAHAFSPDSRQFALGNPDGSISLYDLPSGRPLRRLNPGPVSDSLAFHPNGRQLAIASQGLIQVRDRDSGKVCAEFRHPTELLHLTWGPDGKTLAAVGEDQKIHLWDVATGKPTVLLEGFKNAGIGFAFNRAGDLLASNGWEATLRLWDPRTGQQLFQVRANSADGGPRFGPDGRLLAADVKDGKVRLWEVAASRAYRTLVRDPALGKGLYRAPAVSPSGRLLVEGMTDGLAFWDARTGAAINFVPLHGAENVLFETSGALLTEGRGGPYRWPIRPDPAAPELLRIGPPQRLPLPRWLRACTPDGRVMASSQARGEGAVVRRRDRPGELVQLTPHYDVRSVSVSPDGRWVATGSWWGTGVKIWDAATGRLVADLIPTQSEVGVRFSPDGKWLATFPAAAVCRLWAVDSWQEGPSLGLSNCVVVFSPDSRLVAVETGQNTVRLLDPATGREYARLEDPNQDRATQIAFSPDGTQLVVNGEAQSLHVWDLRAIRQELARRDLDWALPPYPPAAEPPDMPPLRVVVDLGCVFGGDALVGRREWKKAIAAYSVTIEGNPNDALAHNNLAWLLATCPEASFRDPARAVELAKKATALEAQKGIFWNTLGTAQYRAGNWKDAVGALEKSLKLQGDNSWDWFLLAMAGWQLGEKEKARTWFDQAVRWMDRHEPQNEDLRRFHREAAQLLGVKDGKK
jgi:serine/threonine protein kinase/WD40 repeat protein